MDETISRAEFARRLGVTAPIITRAAHDGRLVLDDDGNVLYNASLDRYRATEDAGPVGEAQRERWNKERGEKAAAGSPISIDRAAHVLRVSRAEKAHHEAKIAKLTHERMAGALNDTASIRDGGARWATAGRVRFENLPAQLCHQLAAENDVGRVLSILAEAIERALIETADDLQAESRRLSEAAQA